MTEKITTKFDCFLNSIITHVMKLLGHIPRPLGRKLGDRLGDIGFRLSRKHRKIVLDNLAFALEKELDARQRLDLARAIYRNLGQILFEVGWSLTIPPADMGKYFRIEGLDNIPKALEKDKGLLVIAAHLGNWELLPYVAYRAGVPSNAVYRPLDFKPLDLFFKNLRARYGARMISTHHAMFGIVRALRKKEAVVILMDQSVDWYDGV